MDNYYNKMLKEGIKYQNFVYDVCKKELGTNITSYDSEEDQYRNGENMLGLEIKYDRKRKDRGHQKER